MASEKLTIITASCKFLMHHGVFLILQSITDSCKTQTIERVTKTTNQAIGPRKEHGVSQRGGRNGLAGVDWRHRERNGRGRGASVEGKSAKRWWRSSEQSKSEHSNEWHGNCEQRLRVPWRPMLGRVLVEQGHWSIFVVERVLTPGMPRG